MSLRNAMILASCLALAGCGGLGKDDVPVSLSEAGINTTVNLPSGGQVSRESNGARVKWVGMSWIGSFELDAGRSVTKKTALEKDPSGAYRGEVPVTVGGKRYVCMAGAKEQADAERLMKACDALAAASPAAPTAAPVATAAAAAPVELEERSFTVKASLNDPVKFTARVPKGWATSDMSGTTLVKDPSPASASAISVSFAPAAVVKSVADAEREVKLLDAAGLDTIDEKREVSAGKILVSTAPRGTLKLITIRVFSAGKKGGVLATCSGPSARKQDLEGICASVAAE